MSRTVKLTLIVSSINLILLCLPCFAEEENAEKIKYTYDALFEPPEGMIIHGMGQWDEENAAYLEMLGDPALYPLIRLFFFDIEPVRPWDMVIARLELYLRAEKKAERVPFISLEMSGTEKKDRAAKKKRKRSPYFGVDHVVARTEKYDDRINQVVDMLKAYKMPVFFRIGGEFNGPWKGYHPFQYPKAYRKIVKMFRKKGARNVAFVWCYEPVAPNDFYDRNAKGEYKWFPGEDFIDWFGIDVFKRRDFSAEYAMTTNGQLTVRGRTERFLRMAEKMKKPVVIAESSAADITITARSAWEQWFGPYFSFIERHPCIKAFVYVNADWPKYRRNDPDPWCDGRIHVNPTASKRFVAEIKKKKYLHAGGQTLLNGCKKPPKKKEKIKTRFDKPK